MGKSTINRHFHIFSLAMLAITRRYSWRCLQELPHRSQVGRSSTHVQPRRRNPGVVDLCRVKVAPVAFYGAVSCQKLVKPFMILHAKCHVPICSIESCQIVLEVVYLRHCQYGTVCHTCIAWSWVVEI